MSSASTSTPVRLDRSLSLWQLLVMGVIMVQPTAPMPPFGAISAASGGHAVSTVLIAMCAMMLTALSYGRMARAYPFAGSAYTYVAREIHPALGFLTGWSLLLDYIVNPLICTIWCAKAIIGLFPGVPYAAGALFFALLFTMLNMRGIRATARTNEVLAAAMGTVVVWMVVASVRYLAARGPLSFADLLIPFYDPTRFTVAQLSTGASVAVLTYIGFDGISTLSEEVHDPKRTILRAIVGTCFIIGILSAIEVYVAQLVWPASKPYPDLDTAYIHVAGLAGGPLLYSVMSWTLIVATIGSASGAMLAGARLLYGMGRDSALPKAFFGYLEPHRRIPSRNVLLIGIVCGVGAFLISYQLGAELLNFGALIGFMGVNLSSLLHDWFRAPARGASRRWHHLLAPAGGFTVCFYLWISLNWKARLIGIVWVLFGLAYGAWKTGGFRREISTFAEVSE
ncbi:MAG: APC family permease [Bryobacteraceae bacterium]|jgi:amino acid transporter|nr:APC family permease [Bryobacteraceae bacterium]